jgi:hypothetical protein
VDHSIRVDEDMCTVEADCWTLFFDGSMCSRGKGIGCCLVSPCGVEFEFSTRLEFACTKNQAEYRAL